MPRSRGYSRLSQSRGARRQTEWALGPDTNSNVLTMTANTKELFTLGSEALESFTVVRLRGTIALWLDLVTAIGDGFGSVGVGIGIATADAFAQGTAALAGPLSDADWGGWLVHRMLGPLIGASTTELTTAPMEAVRLEIDSKAMRKMSPNEVLFGIVETAGEVGTAQLRFAAASRVLVKLH